MLTPATVRKHPGNPILVKDRPWEVGILNYTCVLQDREEGLYKMWYQIIRPKAGRRERELVPLRHVARRPGLGQAGNWESWSTTGPPATTSFSTRVKGYEARHRIGWEKDYAASDPSPPVQDDVAAMGLSRALRRHGPIPPTESIGRFLSSATGWVPSIPGTSSSGTISSEPTWAIFAVTWVAGVQFPGPPVPTGTTGPGP